ncbi:MAG: 1-acyl-sn-glycerol-3-phosphate acyltransferase [Anaerolineaceae bacterium]|nr:1-acyl-sn-glycerol-3-phosphate acyltransferase [Anaerolineaceae bacterium]
MNISPRIINWVLKRIFLVACRVHGDDFKKVPTNGPLILVSNHVNFLEVPLVLAFVDNPRLTGMAKKETWDNPFLRFLFNQWKIIPLDRNAVDREAFRMSMQALEEGKLLAVFPEGTRSKTGKLLPGKPGVTMLVSRKPVTLMPVAVYGHENFWENLKRLRRTDFHVAIGEPFRIDLNGSGLDRDARQAVTDEIMYKIAELLPDQYRGHYTFEEPPDYRYAVAA